MINTISIRSHYLKNKSISYLLLSKYKCAKDQYRLIITCKNNNFYSEHKWANRSAQTSTNKNNSKTTSYLLIGQEFCPSNLPPTTLQTPDGDACSEPHKCSSPISFMSNSHSFKSKVSSNSFMITWWSPLVSSKWPNTPKTSFPTWNLINGTLPVRLASWLRPCSKSLMLITKSRFVMMVLCSWKILSKNSITTVKIRNQKRKI